MTNITVDSPSVVTKKQRRTAAFASAIGTTIEWYDFFIYGLAAGLIFNSVFFPENDPVIGTLLAFGTFAVGYVGRPIGALIFGHFGDRIGRKTALVTTMMIMGVCTMLIGMLPSYGTIGIWAPILLIFLRVMQGIGIAGEWGGAVLLAVEYAPKGRKGLYGSWPQIGVPVGLVLSAGVFAILTTVFSEEALIAWAWRIPFLLSAVLIVVGLGIRLKLMDSPAFRKLKENDEVAKSPLKELFKSRLSTILLAMGTKWAEGVGFNTWAVFFVTYLTQEIGMQKTTVLNSVTIAAVVTAFFIPIWGLVSDKIGRIKTYASGTAALALVAFPAFGLVENGSFFIVTAVLVVVFGVFYPMMFGPQGALYAELFEARIRYSGVSVVFQFASVVSSGLTPLALMYFLTIGGGDPWMLCLYIVGVGIVSTLCAIALRNRIIHDEH